jgi:hypothetical protein
MLSVIMQIVAAPNIVPSPLPFPIAQPILVYNYKCQSQM